MKRELPYQYKYPHPAVTTDCVIFGYDEQVLKVLLIERRNHPCKGRWAFPGGFLNIDEAAGQGALRELQEETGLTGVAVHQFHCYSAPDRDPRERVISIAYYAVVRLRDVQAGDDAAQARWFPLDEIPPLAFDHDLMLHDAVEALRARLHLDAEGFEEYPMRPESSQWQSLHDAIMISEMIS